MGLISPASPHWAEMGYTNIRTIEGGAGVCGTQRFLFTCGVCYGIDDFGYRGRFCFDSMQNAELFLANWDGDTYPEVGVDGCKAIK